MDKPVERESRIEKRYTLDSLLSPLSSIQEELSRMGVKSLVGGGVGIDLLGVKYISGFIPRNHGDLDIYIPDPEKGRLRRLTKINKRDFFPFWGLFYRYHISTSYDGVPVDFFFIQADSSGQSVIAEESVAEHISSIRRKYTVISLEPEILEYKGGKFSVLNPSSFQSIGKILSLGYRDRQVLEQLIASRGRTV